MKPRLGFLFFALLSLGASEGRNSEPMDVFGSSTGGMYSDCPPDRERRFQRMAGHLDAENPIVVCHHGNGVYFRRAIDAVRERDWFPKLLSRGSPVREVRFDCTAAMKGKTGLVVNFPTQTERAEGRHGIRIDVPCDLPPEEVKKQFARAAELIWSTADPEELIQAAKSGAIECTATAKEQARACQFYGETLRKIVRGAALSESVSDCALEVRGVWVVGGLGDGAHAVMRAGENDFGGLDRRFLAVAGIQRISDWKKCIVDDREVRIPVESLMDTVTQGRCENVLPTWDRRIVSLAERTFCKRVLSDLKKRMLVANLWEEDHSSTTCFRSPALELTAEVDVTLDKIERLELQDATEAALRLRSGHATEYKKWLAPYLRDRSTAFRTFSEFAESLSVWDEGSLSTERLQQILQMGYDNPVQQVQKRIALFDLEQAVRARGSSAMIESVEWNDELGVFVYHFSEKGLNAGGENE